MDAMPTAMDGASGISPERLAAFNVQAPTSIIGEALNFPYPALFGTFDVPDLWVEFRSGFKIDVPTLVFSGTLDGRTLPEAHAEVLGNFGNGYQITVVNGGHNLFMIDPKVGEVMIDFFQGETPEIDTITVPAPDFK